MENPDSGAPGTLHEKIKPDKSRTITCLCPTCNNSFELLIGSAKKKPKTKMVDIRAGAIILAVAVVIALWIGIGIKTLISRYRIVAADITPVMQQGTAPMSAVEQPSMPAGPISINGKMVTIDKKIYLVGKIKNTGGMLANKQLIVVFLDSKGNQVDKKTIGFPKLEIGETPFEVDTGNRNAVKCKTELK